ncbi:hypothetical protein COV18_03650 [Candidatus Woesearchaeota archaeon CG10_big_fil_rev_8_21_14_0_10_37_12]|nr:MAG: hypothetical protein COV18_03650 [Candidatus Woesearchaeota archaeon CG10_big_fil_rev_8_21_14_0_10_37_12]
MDKKGIDAMIWVIIVLGLGILAYLIISGIFTGQIRLFAEDLNRCPGQCVKQVIPPGVDDRLFVRGVGCDPALNQREIRGQFIANAAPRGAGTEYSCDVCCI